MDMANIVNDTSVKQSVVPISEQMLLVNYVIDLIKKSGIFGNLDIKLNFLSSDKDCICIRLFDDATKTHEYVDGSYEAQIRFSLIYRRLSVNGVSERVNVIDLINQFGMYCDIIEDFEFDNDMIYINTIAQQTNAGLIYRDDSGIEDNSANFVLRYDKN